MKKFLDAIYDVETKTVMLRSPKDENIWVSLNHYQELLTSDMHIEKTCTYTTETVCIGVKVGPAPDYVQTPFGCKEVKTCSCD